MRAGVPRAALLQPFPSPRCGHALLQHGAMLRPRLRQLCAPTSPTNHGIGVGRAGVGGFQTTSMPTFGHGVAPTREGWVAAPRSGDALLQARHQQGQNDFWVLWVLCLPPLPVIKNQHLSPSFTCKPLMPAPRPTARRQKPRPRTSPAKCSGAEHRGGRVQKKHQTYRAVKTSSATVQEGTGVYNIIYTVHTESKNILLTAKCFIC